MATDPRAQDQSVMPEPSWSFIILVTIGCAIARPVVWVMDRIGNCFTRRGSQRM